jgi:multimeric flavodoxin WrbA
MSDRLPLHALALVCTLKPSPAPSSSMLLAEQLLAELRTHGVEGDAVRLVDHDIRPGVELDMGEGDEWPAIRSRVLAADILVVVTPTWMGRPSSVAARLLERLDAELSETDDAGRPLVSGRVALVGVVGNEDGAHHCAAELFQGLDDVGFAIPAQGSTYWNGEAMRTTDYLDLPRTPEATASATRVAAENAAQLAELLTVARGADTATTS